MDFHKRKNQCYDPIRKIWVESTPEEILRQRVVSWMIKEGGYPKNLIAIEKSISVSANHSSSPKRFDVLAYASYKEALVPALLVECKKSIPSSLELAHCFNQITQYSQILNPHIIAIISQDCAIYRRVHAINNSSKWQAGLPLYKDIIES